MRFEGKVAIVTGGTRGIGAAISKALLKEGCRVSVNFRSNTQSAASFRESMNEINKLESKDFIIVQADVSDFSRAKELIDKTIASFGHIDFLVNNAGISMDRTARKMNNDEWNAIINNNLTSVYNCTRNVINHMIDRGSGKIISISSIVALSGNFGQTNYAAAKAGIIGFTKSLALEVVGKGITVNAIAPGFTDTDMTHAMPEEVRRSVIERIPMRRFARPEEIANLAIFLLSDHASYVTGQVISVNGGLYM